MVVMKCTLSYIAMYAVSFLEGNLAICIKYLKNTS